MTGPREKYVLDTNVPINANKSLSEKHIPRALINCVIKCIEIVGHIMEKGGLVLDSSNEIFNEYRNKLRLSGQPGIGDAFIKWVHDYRWQFPAEDIVQITSDGNSYKEFPDHPGLSEFDYSDRKFVAVANAHPTKPPIIQATDSKWWGWANALKDVGITVNFICSDYIEQKYKEKTSGRK